MGFLKEGRTEVIIEPKAGIINIKKAGILE
jgi:hypothetical protein